MGKCFFFFFFFIKQIWNIDCIRFGRRLGKFFYNDFKFIGSLQIRSSNDYKNLATEQPKNCQKLLFLKINDA